MSRTSLLILPCILAVSCGVDRQQVGEPVNMTVVDTIGVESGDERYVFGDIRSVETDHEGNLLVLDGISCRVGVYSPDGEYLSWFGGKGAGPGELQDPLDMTVLSNGETAVTDWDAWGIIRFNSDHSYAGFNGPMADPSPLEIRSGPGGRIIGLAVVFWNDDGQPAGEYYLGSWSDSTSEDFRYMEGLAGVEPLTGGEVSIDLPTVCFDTAEDGHLCAALSTDSTYALHVFSPEGAEAMVIRREWSRVPVDQAAVAALESQAAVRGEELREEDVLASAVAGVHCQADRFWVRVGTSSVPLFHVYSRSGVLVDSVRIGALSDPLFELDFHFGDQRVYAWNTDPVDYPKIFVMEYPI